MSKEVTVEVVCPKREGFEGYWAIQRFFPHGKSRHTIPEDKLAELEAEPLLAVRLVDDAGESKTRAALEARQKAEAEAEAKRKAEAEKAEADAAKHKK